MTTDKDPRNPVAHISWREQLGSGLILALAALILAPTFWRGLACGHDTLTHFYRVVQVALNAQAGAPLTQWSQHFMRGYGYTIYPFYAPLFYWLGAAVHFLGFDFSAALRLLTWLMLFAAGWGGYNLGRRYFNAAGAFITALAYLFAPYLIFNATQRGAFPELLGLALLPWALAAADVALIRRTPRSLVTAVFIFSLLMLSHNIIPNFGFVLLLGLALSRSQSVQPRALWQALWPALVVIGLTLLVTAFFWLPAYVELDFTQARRVDSPFSNWPRYDQHFVQPDDLLGFPEEPADPALTNPPLSLKLGAGQTLLALVGVFLSLALAAYRRPWFWMWALITAVCLFLAAPASGGVWRLLALPEFVQLPSRFLGPASLGVAVLAGIMGDWLGNRLETFRWPQDFHLDFILTTGFYGLGAIFVAVSGWFWLYPVLCPAPVAPHAATVAQATEWNSEGAVSRWGGDSLGETLPRWVDVLPDPDAFMPAYETGEAINRLMLPETAVLHTWTTSAKGDSYTLHLAEPTTLTYRTFYAPYWRAEINGQPAALSPRAGDGLIQVAVPVGEVALSFAFGPTPLRVWMLIVSGITAVLLLIWGWRSGKTAVAALAPPSRRQWGLFGGIVLVLWLLFAYVNLTDNPIRADRFVNGRLAGISNPLQISFGGEFTYLGYDGPASQPADQPICLTQYWTAENAIGVPYRFRLRLADEAGNVWHGPFARPASYADLPGKPGWLVGSYVRDAYEFTLLPGTPPGVYWLEASAFRSDTDLLLLPAGVETAVDPAWARVGQLQITPGNWEPTAANAQVDTFVPTLLAKVAVTELAEVPGLTLLGWTVPDVVWRPGELAQVDLLWQGDSVIWDEQVTAELALVNEDGEQVAETAVPIGSAGAKEVIRNKVQWRLPPELETGTYTIWLSLGEQRIELGDWQIDAPQRIFAQPEVDITSDFAVDFGRLVGYSTDLPATSTGSVTGKSVEVELVWQAVAETAVNYRVFVHLLDENGNLVTQSDAVPDHWTRPTTGWVPGEYITDRHTLTLPADAIPGQYTLLVGFYDTATQIRAGETRLPPITIK